MTEGVSDVWVIRSDWQMDLSLPEKLHLSNISHSLFDTGNGADGTD